jgi:hypothetical protein
MNNYSQIKNIIKKKLRETKIAFMRLIFSYDTKEKPLVTETINELKLTLIADTELSLIDG